MIEKRDQSSTLPGIGAALKTGFELTTRSPWLLVLPVALDLLFWLGPRLSLAPLVGQWIEFVEAQLATLDSAETATLALPELLDQLIAMTEQYNLMTHLSLPYLGIPTLMGGLAPESTPIATQSVPLNSLSSFFEWFLLLTLLAMVGSAIYYSLIAFTISGSRAWSVYGRVLPRQIARFVGLCAALVLLVLALYIPVSLIGAVLALISPALFSIAVLAAVVAVFWLLLYLGFTVHGLFLDNRPIHRAIANSVRFVRSNALSAIPLLVLLYILNNLLNIIWMSAYDGSWLTLVSILGHAFISTALITATFAFYQSRRIYPDEEIYSGPASPPN